MIGDIMAWLWNDTATILSYIHNFFCKKDWWKILFQCAVVNSWKIIYPFHSLCAIHQHYHSCKKSSIICLLNFLTFPLINHLNQSISMALWFYSTMLKNFLINIYIDIFLIMAVSVKCIQLGSGMLQLKEFNNNMSWSYARSYLKNFC